MPIPVSLTRAEQLLWAHPVFGYRQVTNERDGRQDVYGAEKRDGEQNSLDGCLTELAAAKGINVYWSGAFDLGALDIGFALQVRSTRNPNGGLIIHERDNDDEVFILVTGGPTHYVLQGAMRAGDAKKDAYWRADWTDPAWCVPQHALDIPIESLVRTCVSADLRA